MESSNGSNGSARRECRNLIKSPMTPMGPIARTQDKKDKQIRVRLIWDMTKNKEKFLEHIVSEKTQNTEKTNGLLLVHDCPPEIKSIANGKWKMHNVAHSSSKAFTAAGSLLYSVFVAQKTSFDSEGYLNNLMIHLCALPNRVLLRSVLTWVRSIYLTKNDTESKRIVQYFNAIIKKECGQKSDKRVRGQIWVTGPYIYQDFWR